MFEKFLQLFMKNKIDKDVKNISKLYSLTSCAKYIANEFMLIKKAHVKPSFSFLYSFPMKNIVIVLKIEGITDESLNETSVSGKKHNHNLIYK